MANKVYEIVTSKIIDSLEKGIIPWKSPYAFNGHQNFASGYKYGSINSLLLSMDAQLFGYEYPFWATINQINNLGGKVKKGSTASIITMYVTDYKKPKKVVEAESDITEEEEIIEDDIEVKDKKKFPAFIYRRIFNISCVEGIDVEKIISKKATVKKYTGNNALLSYIENEGISFRDNQPTDCSYYAPAKDEIVMSYIKTQEQYDQVLAHEITHSTGHPKRLNRFNIEFEESHESRSFEELVAEIGSAFLLNALNLPMAIENSVSYIDSWLDFLQFDQKKSTIVRAASQAQKACEYVLEKAEEKEKVA